MNWVLDDGGRAAAGFKGKARDCVCRAVAIAAELPYREVYDLINQLNREFPPRGTKSGPAQPKAWSGCSKKIIDKLFKRLGWAWTPTMGIGTGCTVHLREDELPAGRLVVNVSCHLVAVIDGVLYDNHDSRRGGMRCVYGYWRKP